MISSSRPLGESPSPEKKNCGQDAFEIHIISVLQLVIMIRLCQNVLDVGTEL
jgi:hypothetical protein